MATEALLCITKVCFIGKDLHTQVSKRYHVSLEEDPALPAGFCSCDVGCGDGLAEGNAATRLPRFEGKGGVTRFCCCDDGEGCCSCGAIRLRGAVGVVAGRAGGAIVVVVVDAGFDGETVVMGRMGSELPSGLGGVVIVGVVLKGE